MALSDDVVELHDLLHEDVVYERFGHLFAERELREARKGGKIGFYDTRKGPFYSKVQLSEYLKSKERTPCENRQLSLQNGAAKEKPKGFSKSGHIGLVSKKPAPRSTIIGMTPELEAFAADQLDAET